MALLNAVPSFAPRWAASEAEHRAFIAAHPRAPRTESEQQQEFLWSLASHVGNEFARGEHVEELPWLFAALERIYADADDDLWNALTIGFFEDVIYAADRGGHSAKDIGAHASGPLVAHAWQAAYDYIHPVADPRDAKRPGAEA